MQDNFIICLLYQKNTDSYIHFPKVVFEAYLLFCRLI